MKKNVWDEREKAFEDKYFHDLEREQLRRLREKNAPCAAEDMAAVAPSDSGSKAAGREKK
ncbi:MAG: hypothetical protein RBR43_04035 [Desulfuromonadaceae bacterium]|nr:hypothetical protein [Desulfuromonas sp.]MDY0185039.1 hypothetical protein [Desulfuromonadaceae bacterium]